MNVLHMMVKMIKVILKVTGICSPPVRCYVLMVICNDWGILILIFNRSLVVKEKVDIHDGLALYGFQHIPSSLIKRSIVMCFMNHHLQSMAALNKSLVINHSDVHGRWIIKGHQLCHGKNWVQESSVHFACGLSIS